MGTWHACRVILCILNFVRINDVILINGLESYVGNICNFVYRFHDKFFYGKSYSYKKLKVIKSYRFKNTLICTRNYILID